VQLFDWLTVIHTHDFTDLTAQYLKENIAGASPMFMKVKTAFVALAGAGPNRSGIERFPRAGRRTSKSNWVELLALFHDSDRPQKPTSYGSTMMRIWFHDPSIQNHVSPGPPNVNLIELFPT
jgi:hypothetical protein